MSILDTFSILFKADGVEAVETGATRATNAGKKLQTELNEVGETGVGSAQKITEANSRLAESFDKIKEHAGEMASRLIEHAMEVAAAFEALFAVEKLVDSVFETAETSDQLGERARSIGVDVADLDAWGNAAKRVGGSADAFGESLINVNRQMARMEATGKSRILPFFKELGVAMEKNGKPRPIMELLPELAKATEGKSKQESAGALRGIGFDEGTIRLLQRGEQGVNALIARQRQLGNVTAEDAEAAEKFNIEWMDIQQLFHQLVVEFDTYFLPTLEAILGGVESLVEYLESHKDLAVGFFLALGAAALWAADAFGVFGFVLGIVTSPITLIIAAVLALAAAFAFAYDDLMAFSRGGNSLIGEWAKVYPIVGEIAHGIIDVFSYMRAEIVDAISGIIAWFRKIPEGIKQWEEIGGIVAGYVRYILDALENLIPGASDVFGDLGAIFFAFPKIVISAFELLYQGVKFAVVALWDFLVATFHLIADLVTDPEHAFQNFANRAHASIARINEIMPKLSAAFQAVGSVFATIGSQIMALFNDIGQVVTQVIDRVHNAVAGIGGITLGGIRAHLPGWLGGTPAAVPGLEAAQTTLTNTNSPLPSLTPGALAAGGAGGKQVTNNVTVQGSTINATSSNPADIAHAVDATVGKHVSGAVNHLADGVAY